MKRIAPIFLALVLLAALPESVFACPVCFDRDDESRIAFLATTGLLTFLPLGLVLGTTMWLKKRARDLEGFEKDEPRDEEGSFRS